MATVPFRIICDACMVDAKILAAEIEYGDRWSLYITCHDQHELVSLTAVKDRRIYAWSDIRGDFKSLEHLLSVERSVETEAVNYAKRVVATRTILAGKRQKLARTTIPLADVDTLIYLVQCRVIQDVSDGVMDPDTAQTRYELWERTATLLMTAAGAIKPK